MRAAGASIPKPLVPIRGVPLLERNLVALLYAGFRDLVVAVPSHTPEIAEFVDKRGRALAGVLGARLRLLEETSPLGNIGAAAEVELDSPELLVVFADNLTALPLAALVDYHRRSLAALTTAVHLETFRIPFGEVEVSDGLLVAYREKPERRFWVSSGLYVLGAGAIESVPRGRPAGVSALVNCLMSAGEHVAAFVHEAPWIDVNDTETVARAGRLIASHPDAFECRSQPPDSTVASTLTRDGGRVLLEKRDAGSGRYPGTWDLPGRVLAPGETVAATPMCIFDDIDPDSRRVYRHLVFAHQPAEPLSSAAFWHDLTEASRLSPVARRALAAAGPE
jgi:NDP-sugar pyrophosphorylase family protein